MEAVDTGTSFDVFVGEDHLLEVYRGPDLIVTQRFGHVVNYRPSVIPLQKPRKHRRLIDWLVPVLFVLGVIWCVWLVLR